MDQPEPTGGASTTSSLLSLCGRFLRSYPNRPARLSGDSEQVILSEQVGAEAERVAQVLVPSAHWKSDSSCGQGVWAKLPWVAVFDSRETEQASRGVYVVVHFLFGSDDGTPSDLPGVRIALTMSAQATKGEDRQDKALQILADIRGLLEEQEEEFGSFWSADSGSPRPTREPSPGLQRQSYESVLLEQFLSLSEIEANPLTFEQDLRGLLSWYQKWVDASRTDKSKGDAEQERFISTMRAYHRDRVQFLSATKGAMYFVDAVDSTGATILRFGKGTRVRCTAAKAVEAVKRLQNAGGRLPFEDFTTGNRAVRNACLQCETVAISADKSLVVDISQPERAMSVFADYLTSMKVDKSQGYSKRFKPAMLAAAIDGVQSGDLRDNQILFQTILPRFTKRMETLGEQVTVAQAVMAFYHLASEPFWLLSYRDIKGAITTSHALTEKELNERVAFAMFRPPFWKLVSDASHRAGVLKILQDRWWPTDLDALTLNEPLLALAVEKNIRPSLVGDGELTNVNEEGYHHQKVIPKAQPHLTPEALQKDAVGEVRKALAASSNLLSQFEGTWALGFLDNVNPDDARDRFLDLLHGPTALEKRVREFHGWAKLRDVAEGEKIGFNPTAISYLLGVSSPTKYAFCKPTVYEKAAIALLGSANVPKDKVDRVAHASRFYHAALTLLKDRHGLPFNDLMHSHIAFYLMAYPKNGRPGWDDLADSPPPTPTMNEHNNLILYGPPGTGKTYHTIHQAVRICDGHASPDRDALVQRFKALQDEGRISFVTFHQSYSYEDFVEGIRPVMTNEQLPEAQNSDVQYECRPGVFRMVCEAARGASVGSRVKYEFDPDAVSVWKMSLGNTAKSDEAGIFDECIENGYALLGYGRGLDFAGCGTKEEIEARLMQKEPSFDFTEYEVNAVHWFKNKMSVGDLIVVSDGNWKFRAIGKVTGECERLDRPDDTYSQMRPVEWLFVTEESLPHERILNRIFSQATIYRLRPHVLKHDAMRDLLRTTGSTVPKNCVLIIDEINRGNIAKILGELITLLEPDKRLGAPNELQIRLPYSRDLFGVPANLFIVGTMNTADRSIALLDTALRRRFHFREMMPDLDVVRATVGDHGRLSGVDVAELLETINERVEQLFDRDHQIGHAYVLGVRSLVELRGVFCDKIIPLLQEYFYGDWGKVCAVLGCSYDSDTGKQVNGNRFPLITSRSLSGLSQIDAADYQPKIRCHVNPAFLKADESAVGAFFRGVVTSSENGRSEEDAG